MIVATCERKATLEGVAIPAGATADEALELRRREDYAACCCGIQNLTLSLWVEGVSVKWTTGKVTRDPRFAQIVGFDEEKESVVGLLWFGFPKVIGEQKRRPMERYFSRVP